MTKDEALDLALEVLQINHKLLEKINPYKGQEDLLSDSLDLTHKAITAIKQARALDKKAENARELGLDYEPVTILPDGSAFGVMSFPLPDDHWLYAPNEYRDGEYERIDLPKPILTHALREAVVAAVRYAVRGATMRGKETDFDPDALVQNAVYALCGPYTTPPAQPAPVQEPAIKQGWDVDTLLDKPAAPVQDSTCSETLRAQGKAYPRTCRKCGLGPCIGAPKQPPAAQRQWVGLTDEEIEDLCWTEVDQRLRSFARAIEAKLREKNA